MGVKSPKPKKYLKKSSLCPRGRGPKFVKKAFIMAKQSCMGPGTINVCAKTPTAAPIDNPPAQIVEATEFSFKGNHLSETIPGLICNKIIETAARH